MSEASPRIIDGVTPLSAGGLNPPLDALQTQIDALRTKVNSYSSSVALTSIVYGIDSSCTKGMVVALDPSTGRYVPAAAEWSGVSAADGTLIPSYTAYAVGLLLSDVAADTSGTLLWSGAYQSTAIATILSNGARGVFYLTTNGAVSSAPSDLPVYVLSISGTDIITFNPSTPDTRGHSHRRIVLDADLWYAAGNSALSGYTAPAGATYGYDVDNDAVASQIFAVCKFGYSLALDGVELTPASYVISGGTLWLLTAHTAPINVLFHGISPFLGSDPVVKSVSIETGTTILKALSENGVAVIGFNPVKTSTSNTGKCIGSIGKTGYVESSCVNELRSGAGIALTQATSGGSAVPGTFIISSEAVASTYIDCQLVNNNGTVIGADSYGTYIKFPTGRIATVTGTCRIPYSATSLFGRVLVWTRGSGAAISGLTASVACTTAPAIGGSVSLSEQLVYSMSGISGSTDTSKVYAVNSVNQITFSGNMLVTITMTLDLTGVSAVDLNMINFGIMLESEDE